MVGRFWERAAAAVELRPRDDLRQSAPRAAAVEARQPFGLARRKSSARRRRRQGVEARDRVADRVYAHAWRRLHVGPDAVRAGPAAPQGVHNSLLYGH